MPRPTAALFRIKNQFGGTFGGRVIRDKTFLGSLMRWTDRRLGSGTLISGAPTEESRRLLQDLAGSRPTVRALLENLPTGVANGQSASASFGDRTVSIPLGNVTGSGGQRFNDWQYSYRVDHRFTDKHSLMARYMDDKSDSTGTGQITPPGLSSVIPSRTRSASAALTSSFTSALFNELRLSFWQTRRVRTRRIRPLRNGFRQSRCRRLDCAGSTRRRRAPRSVLPSTCRSSRR